MSVRGYRRSALTPVEIKRSAQSLTSASAHSGVSNQSAGRRVAGVGDRPAIATDWYEHMAERAAASLEGDVCTAMAGQTHNDPRDVVSDLAPPDVGGPVFVGSIADVAIAVPAGVTASRRSQSKNLCGSRHGDASKVGHFHIMTAAE